MIVEHLRLRAERHDFNRTIAFQIRTKREGRITAIAEPIILKHFEKESAYSPETTFELNDQAAQILMDDLWSCGLRPTEGKGSAGCLAATEKHLEDVREMLTAERKIREDIHDERKKLSDLIMKHLQHISELNMSSRIENITKG